MTCKIKGPKKLNRPKHNIKRKRKFTRRNRKLIYEALRKGLSISNTMKLAGLDRSTYYRWMKKGKDAHYPIHQRFRKAVMRIQTELEIEKLEIIRKVAKGGYMAKEGRVRFSKKNGLEIQIKIIKKDQCWQAAAWFLERRYPEDYGKKRRLHDGINPEEKARQVKQALDSILKSVPI